MLIANYNHGSKQKKYWLSHRPKLILEYIMFQSYSQSLESSPVLSFVFLLLNPHAHTYTHEHTHAHTPAYSHSTPNTQFLHPITFSSYNHLHVLNFQFLNIYSKLIVFIIKKYCVHEESLTRYEVRDNCNKNCTKAMSHQNVISLNNILLFILDR